MVQADSGYRAFNTPSCPPSVALVEKYFTLSSSLASIYPASYNEDDILSKIIRGLEGVSGALSFMPGRIGMIAKIANPAFKAIGGVLGKGKSKKAKKSGKQDPEEDRLEQALYEQEASVAQRARPPVTRTRALPPPPAAARPARLPSRIPMPTFQVGNRRR